MLSTNQIAGLPKVLYLKNELRYEIELLYVSNVSTGHGEIYAGVIYSKDTYSQYSYVYWALQTEGPMKLVLSVHLSLLELISSIFFVGVVRGRFKVSQVSSDD